MSDFIMGLAGVIQKEVNMLSSVAQNAANANSTGYKSVQAFQAMAGIGNGETLPPVATQQQVQLSDGALKFTGRPADLALSGNAWFVLETPMGVRLTRDGRFQVTPEGVLANQAGWPVQGDGGVLRPESAEFVVGRDGTIMANGKEVGKLRLLAADRPADITLAEKGLYQATSLSKASGFVVHQGMLEQSNVNLGADMVRLMEATRHMESVQRALRAYDTVLESGISQIGKD